MVAPGIGIDSPRTELPSDGSIGDLDLGSRMDSFQSPGGGDDIFKANKGGRRNRANMTPARQIFGSIANRGGPSKNEFTPLLKSVQKSNLRAKVGDNKGVPPTPAFLKNGKLDIMDSPALPHAERSSYGGDESTYQSQNDTILGPMPDSSINSTPVAVLPRRGENVGVLEHDGQMTLREQEKIIDEIKKENFGLKLKIVFMEERLKKLGPEHNEEAIKENIEIKVERATLKAELKRYRKSLNDSEKAITELREQMMSIQDSKQKGYDNGRRSEERARALQEMSQQLEEKDKALQKKEKELEAKEKELDEVLDENDRLREEAQDYKKQVDNMEEEDDEEVQKINKELEKVEEAKAELETEMREKDRLLDEREAELDSVDAELRGKDREIQELKSDTKSLQERLKAMEKELQGKQGDRDELLIRKDEALRKAEQKIRDYEKLVRDLQNNIEDEQREKSRVLQEKKKVQTENEQVRKNQTRLEHEKQSLEDALEKIRDEARNKSFAYKGRIGERENQRENLKGELEQLRQEYDSLQALHQERAAETQRLKSRLEQLNGDFDGEFQTLRTELNDVKRQRDTINQSRVELEGKVRKLESDFQLITSEKDSIEKSHQELELEMRKARSARSEIEVELRKVQSNMQSLAMEKDSAINSSRSELENELRRVRASRNELEAALRKAQSDLHDIQAEKELIRQRHDALTTESEDFQRQVDKLRGNLQEANLSLQRERQMAEASEQSLRREWEEDKSSLNEELEAMDRELAEKEKQHERAISNWQSEKRQLEIRIQKAETTAEDLKRTIEQLQQAESSTQGKETKLVSALRSENERHKKEEAGLNQQILELQDEIEERKTALDVKIAEHNATKEELRLSRKAERALEEKVRYLDDEVELLSAQLEEEKDNADEEIEASKAEVETLRQKLNATKLELSRLENQHGKARYEAQAVKGDLELEVQTQRALKEDIQDTTRRLENVKKEKHQLQEQLAKANTQTNTLRVATMELEAERDELKSQLQQISHKADSSKHLDHEKAELRKAKSKIEIDLQRAKDECAVLEQRANDLEADLQDAIDAAQEQEIKLENQVRELKGQLKSFMSERESERQASQRDISRLEARIDELLKLDRQDGGLELELEVLRASLSDGRKRENDFIQKEAASRKTIRELRHQVDELDRELLDNKNAAALQSPPVGSTPRSGRKSEVEELRRQISACQEQIREYRSKVKTLERKNGDQKAAYEQLEIEKSLLDQEIAEIRESNEAMVRKNFEVGGTVGELRKRIHTLERELHSAKLDQHLKNSEDTRTAQQQIAEERQELHEHIKTATLEIEQLQAQMNARDEEIRIRRKKEKELDAQVRNLRKEKSQLDSISQGTSEDLKKVTRRYQKAVEKTAHLQAAWDEERRAIKQRVRFSESTSRRETARTDADSKTLETQIGQTEVRHRAEIKGLAKQIRYLRAKVAREAGFRADLSFSKNFFLMQINLYSACNEANMQLIEQMGIFPDRYIREKRPSLRSVVHALIAGIRISKLQRSWAESKELKTSLAKSLELTRRGAAGKT